MQLVIYDAVGGLNHKFAINSLLKTKCTFQRAEILEPLLNKSNSCINEAISAIYRKSDFVQLQGNISFR